MGTPNQLIKAMQRAIGNKITRAADGSRVVGNLTLEKRRSVLKVICNDLYELGFQLKEPSNIKNKHVVALGLHWERKGYSASVIQNRLSMLRVICEWIGKPGLVRDSVEYVNDPARVTRKTATSVDKGLEATTDLDWIGIVQKALEIDRRVAAMLIMARWFGLRATEALMYQPHVDDVGFALHITRGTKGGKNRIVEVTPERRWVLDTYVKPLVELKTDKKGVPLKEQSGSLCWPEKKTIKSGYGRLHNICSKYLGLSKKDIGVTFHGARHDFVNAELERLGYISPVRGGNHKEQMEANPERTIAALQQVIQQVGHVDPSKTTAYCGSDKSMKLGKRGKPRLDWSGGRRKTDDAQSAGDTEDHAEDVVGGTSANDVDGAMPPTSAAVAQDELKDGSASKAQGGNADAVAPDGSTSDSEDTDHQEAK